MNSRDVLICMGVLVATLIAGLTIVYLWNNVYTQLLFVVVMALAFIWVNRYHKRDNIYRCMKCGQKFRVGLIPDIISPNLENGDKVIKCKKCKIKVNFRSEKKFNEGKS